MDFDEYEYLEKTVENPDLPSKGKESPANGNGRKSESKERSRSLKHGIDESERDSDHHRSKRARSGDRERSSSRHRSSSEHRSRDRDRERDREGRNGKDKDEDRERDREREKRREREREIERELERSRRSRSRSQRHLVEERDIYREKSRDRELRERERERERELRERDRDGRRYRDKKEEIAEPEADPERDQRTVFAYQLNLRADERDVYEFFSRAGKVRDVRLIMDRNSRRSKGVGYIEFYDVMSVPMAIALSGQPLRGQAVMVKPSEAEKNLVQSTATAGAGGQIGPYSGGARRLYVGNLHFNMTEDQLRQVFEPFGAVELVQLPLDESGHCKGFGFVQFAQLEHARAAQSLNGQLEIAGKLIKVSAVSDQDGMQEAGANAADFDDDESGGMSLNAQSRALLMQKLDRSGTTTSVAGALVTPSVNTPLFAVPTASVLGAPPVGNPLISPIIPALAGLQAPAMTVAHLVNPLETVGAPSECLLLKNMFDPSVETEPDFDLDIKEDVQDECSKIGKVNHIFVDKNSAGHVYLRFEGVRPAMEAQRSLHGRWFAGKQISATFMLPQSYDAKFPQQ